MPYKPTGRRAGRPVGISNEQFSLKHRKTLLKKIATDKTIDNRTRLAAIDLYTKLAGDIQKDNLNGVVETVITFAEDPLKPATIDFNPIEKTTTPTTTTTTTTDIGTKLFEEGKEESKEEVKVNFNFEIEE